MKKHTKTHVMSKVMIFVFTIIFIGLFGRYAYIQATGSIENVSLKDWADKKRTTAYTLNAERGKILDRNGMILAYDRPTYRLFAVIDENHSKNSEEPKHVTDPNKTAQMLAPLLDISEKDILTQLNKEGPFQVEFGINGRYLSQELRDEIKALKLPGIDFIEEAKRYYPNGMFASHIVGFSLPKEGEVTGVLGIEREMNERLTGENGYISYKRDKYNIKLLNPEEVVKESKDGLDIFLTLDQKIQTFLEDAMSQVNEQYKPERMMAIVMNPKTGEVLAMSNRPSFNPNNRENIQNWYNDVIAYPFEPGSTMKIFTLAAAINEGEYDGEELYQSGRYQINNVNRIHDHRRTGWGEITFLEGIQRSSNVAAAILAWEKLGPERFYNYLTAFHFDQASEIDLPGEQPGKILYNWPIEKVTASFGQGSTTTPIQLMKAASAVANGGKMMKPYVVDYVYNKNTEEIMDKNEPEVVGEPITKETAQTVRDILETVITSENGTGKNYKLEDYTVAGKTGTAQISDSETGGYLEGDENYIFSFLGMAPKDNPELIMYVSVKQPNLSKNELGSEPVSYIFKTVMENSLHYLNVQPDQNQSVEELNPYKLPKLIGENINRIKSELKAHEVQVIQLGVGTEVIKTVPGEGEEVLPNDQIFIKTDGEAKLPDLTGWSIREVLKLGNLYNLKVEFLGNGYVTKQSIPAKATIREGSYLVVDLEIPQLNSESNNQSEMTEEQVDTTE